MGQGHAGIARGSQTALKPSVANSPSQTSKGGGPASAYSERGGTVTRVLDAAESVFAESGFAGASVRDIASRAGLNAAAAPRPW